MRPAEMQSEISRPTFIASHSALRGIAALTVFLLHAEAATGLQHQHGIWRHVLQLLSWDDIAVFLFFILSGFVMSHVYPDPVDWRHFGVARLARLVPVYEATLLLMIAFNAFAGDRTFPAPPNAVANVLMIQRWLPIPGWFAINGPSWSLSVEAFLYVLVFPLLILTRKLARRNSLYVFLVVGGTLWGTVCYNYVPWQIFLVSWSIPMVSGIAGFCLGFALQSLVGAGVQHPNTLAWTGFAFAALSMLDNVIYPLEMSRGLLVMGLVLIVTGSVDPRTSAYRLLARPSLLYLGDISYSLYLWHPLVLLTVLHASAHFVHRVPSLTPLLGSPVGTFGLSVVVAFALATVSYYWLEVPCRRLIRDALSRPRMRDSEPAKFPA